MALEGELKGLQGTTCMDCHTPLKLQVLQSAAGFYLGYFCPQCGPYSRETGYYPTRDAAEADLKKMVSDNIRTTEFRPGPPEIYEL